MNGTVRLRRSAALPEAGLRQRERGKHAVAAMAAVRATRNEPGADAHGVNREVAPEAPARSV